MPPNGSSPKDLIGNKCRALIAPGFAELILRSDDRGDRIDLVNIRGDQLTAPILEVHFNFFPQPLRLIRR